MTSPLWPCVCALLAACVATVTDLRSRLIPNWLTLPLCGGALAAHGLSSGTAGLLGAVVGALCCFLPAYFLFVRCALGGGDVKLFAAFGALLGARVGLELELTAFVLVALFALWSSAWSGKLWLLLRASFRATLHLALPARFPRPEPGEGSFELPMGGAILLAVLALLARTWS